MDEIYENVEDDKPVDSNASQNQRGPRSSERRFHGSVVLCLGLLNVFLLAALIGLRVHCCYSIQHSAAELSTVKASLRASYDKSSSLMEERDLLNVCLIAITKQQLSRMSPCPAGWKMFHCSCYLLSSESGSWEKGREDCRGRGADLVVIDSSVEQMFISDFTKEETWAWIGLTDRVKEGTWVWTDGAPLSRQYWQRAQPDNGGGHGTVGEEDCAHIISGVKHLRNWSDLSCTTSLRWICEKRV